MNRLRPFLLAAVLVIVAAAPALADATVFLGATTTPANRHVIGGALGFGLVIIGFEFEFASTTDDPPQNAPSLKTGMGNVLLQSPVPILNMQPYVTAGVGISQETLGTHDETSTAFNTGGGVKIGLSGPLRLRIDYRAFKLGNNALHSPVHRVYAGLNLGF